MADLLGLVLRINLAAAGAVVLTLILRRPARRLFGACIAYGLWALAPLAALAMLAPARTVTLTRPAAPLHLQAVTPAVTMAPSFAAAPASGLDLPAILATIWVLGAAAALAHLVWRQVQFGRAMRAGRAGPAVVGVLRPRIVTPDDFAQRYTPREQQVILAHERTHIARHDSRINALVALARGLAWFNPALHLLAHHLRIDQEFACDAQVVAAHPAARRAYAEAMLKTQLAARPLPLGCYWPAQTLHPLALRIDLLSRPAPGPTGRRAGAALMTLLALGGAALAWASRPPEIVLAPSPMEASPARAVTSEPEVSTLDAPAPRPTVPIAAPNPTLAQVPPSPLAADPIGALIQKVAAAAATAQPSPTPEPNPERYARIEAESAGQRPMAPGQFGPAKVHALATWSRVEPGSAVRVLATVTAPDGVPLTTDLTAFGSQSWYRLGYVSRGGSHYKLFTSVTQHGDRLQVMAGFDRSFQPLVTGSLELGSGETGTIRLPSGQMVTVTATLRPESPEELESAHRHNDRGFVNVERVAGL